MNINIALGIAIYFALSIPFSILVGKFIAYGTGSDLENQP